MHIEAIKKSIITDEKINDIDLMKEVVIDLDKKTTQMFLFPIDFKKGTTEMTSHNNKPKTYVDISVLLLNSVSNRTNFEQIHDELGFTFNLERLTQIATDFPDQAEFFNIFRERTGRFYALLTVITMIFITEFFYNNALYFKKSGKTLAECQKKAFRIAKVLQQEIIKELIEIYDITTTKIPKRKK